MSKKNKIWNEKELTIAYYIAKWGFSGLQGITLEELVNYVMPDATVGSLKMQIANFRHVLGFEERTLKDASKAMYDLHEQLKNKTMTQVRSSITPDLEVANEQIADGRIKAHNMKVRADRDKKQAAADAIVENKLKQLSKQRNLRRVQN
jgi:hypothetical protein